MAMFSRMIFRTGGEIANSDYLAGAMIITIAICAMAEVARPLRFLNLLFGLWLAGAPWLLGGATALARLRRGPRGKTLAAKLPRIMLEKVLNA